MELIWGQRVLTSPIVPIWITPATCRCCYSAGTPSSCLLVSLLTRGWGEQNDSTCGGGLLRAVERELRGDVSNGPLIADAVREARHAELRVDRERLHACARAVGQKIPVRQVDREPSVECVSRGSESITGRWRRMRRVAGAAPSGMCAMADANIAAAEAMRSMAEVEEEVSGVQRGVN